MLNFEGVNIVAKEQTQPFHKMIKENTGMNMQWLSKIWNFGYKQNPLP